MLKELFKKQRTYLNSFYESFDISHFEAVFQKILACKGVLFFTGIGKSGFIAQKIAATLMSTGTKAFFLSPIDALHGDLGTVMKEDMLFILSKSGETEELVQLLPFVRSRGSEIIAVTSNPNSRLVKGANFSIFLPCERELCPFDLAPTISTELQLLFGDCLAIALMQAKGFTLDAFAENHPKGRVGKRATLRVRDLMLDFQKTPLCAPEDLLQNVLSDFSNKRCGCLVVVDSKKELKGIFTDGDLRRSLQEKGEKVLKEKVKDLMTHTPRSIEANALAWDALKLMESDQKHPIMVLPVLDEAKKEVVGIIKMHDLIQAGL